MGVSVQELILFSAMLALPAGGQAASPLPSTATTHATAARSPYTAEYKVISVAARPSGTTTNYESSEVKAVDAQGREMTEKIGTLATVTGPTTSTTSVSVFDPVAHTLTNWNSLLKQATEGSLGEGADLQSCATAGFLSDAISRAASREKSTVQDLGMETIDGIEAHGTRTTFTTPPAPSDRNEAPLITVTERWIAVDVALKGLPVREMTDHSPRHSGWTKELTRLKQGDPDPALFAPPPGYKIVKEQATCELKDW
jgi:hypothetical protein